jgi:hypothetical protein
MIPRTQILTAAMLVSVWFGLAGPASAFYDPSAQRWINRDPSADLGFRGKQTKPDRHSPAYVFSANDPLNSHDPRGLAVVNPLSYGNWCGPANQGQGGPPIDEVDTACETHDLCLATPTDFLNPCNQIACNFQFCKAVEEANCSRSPNPSQCRQEKAAILAVCDTVLGPLPLWVIIFW